MTSTDWVKDAQEVLWAAAQQFGLRLEAGDQVAVARELARTEPHLVTTDLVQKAFRTAKVSPPSDRLAREVVARAQRVRPRPGLREVLLSFREDAIRTLSRQYGGKDKDEDSLRNNLLLYLRPRGYAEAHTSKGRMDIVLPPPDDVVIETKVWTSQQKYDDGMTELGEYIRTEKPKEAYMVVFCDRVPLPPIVADHRQAVALERDLEGLRVPVVVVPFDVDPPSKVGAMDRKRRKAR